MLQSCWKTAWLSFKTVNMDLLHGLSTLKCSPRERKPFILRLVHNRSQQFGLWWLPNWKLTCKKERNVYINIGVFVPAKTDGWISDTWSNLAEAPRNSALWLGQINFSHTHAPPIRTYMIPCVQSSGKWNEVLVTGSATLGAWELGKGRI